MTSGHRCPYCLGRRLTEVTGTLTQLAQRPEGGVRLTTPLPDDLDGNAQVVVVQLLAEADRFGHRYQVGAHSVWAELD